MTVPIHPILAVTLAFGFGLATTTQAADSRVQPEVTKTLEESGSVDIFVSFHGNPRSNEDIIKNIDQRSFSSREEKATALIQELKNNMELTQKDAMTAIQNSPVARSKQLDQFWIANELYVAGADQATIDVLLGVDKVSQITKEVIYPIEPPSPGNKSEPGEEENARQNSIQWGVEAVNASFAWKQGSEGQGIVVGIIDTGVNGEHEALRDGFRSQNGWYDPNKGTRTPTDNVGHGTHCIGSAVGRTKGIGVAPKAMWIACAGCVKAGCTENLLLKCGQWMACPSKGSCRGIPNIVTNSWGGPRVDSMYRMVDTWVSVGIHPVFAAGNDGPKCGSIADPGIHPKAISVANIDQMLHLHRTSSRGPSSRDRSIQPDVAGPGTAVYSAWKGGKNAYQSLTGTSMACPHVAGVVALLISNHQDLSVDQVHRAIVEATVPINTQGVPTCGNTANGAYPNNLVGHGLVSVSRLKLLQIGTASSSQDSMDLFLGGKAFTVSFVMCVLYFT